MRTLAGQDRDRQQAVVSKSHCFQKCCFFVPSISSSSHTSIESSCKACSALFYISTLLSQSWLLFLFSPFILDPSEIYLWLRAICHLQTFPFSNSPATLTSTRDWAEMKKRSERLRSLPYKTRKLYKIKVWFHWSRNLIWLYISLAFLHLFPG